MSRWTTFLWQALVALGQAEYPYSVSNDDVRGPREYKVDLTDDAVRAAFRELVEREWGNVAFSDTAPWRQSWRAEPDGNPRRPGLDPFWERILLWRCHLPW
ncbi:hypothetical protein ACGFI9_36185 [Micromonospora sp. NPDC048930]|uniref:hypothetical protein n=1 Tax=Micromonospora sp. NPDC048930 TaxID=3364261 RepID=UPI00370F8074